MKEIQDFDSIRIKLASPEQIKDWSYGEASFILMLSKS